MKKLNRLNQTRREHVQSLFALVAASTLPVFSSADDGAFTPPQTVNLSDNQALQMLAVARALFPHDMLSDRYYWPVVSAIDNGASDEATAALLKNGLESLGPGFPQLDAQAQEAALASLEGSGFFAFVHGQTVNGLYANPEIWPMFGFEGSSVEHGGYLHRGFDQIDWLPQEKAESP
jgi:hypothetical protein